MQEETCESSDPIHVRTLATMHVRMSARPNSVRTLRGDDI